MKKLIAGPKVQICDECVDICISILSEDRKDAPVSQQVDGRPDVAGKPWPSGPYLICGLCHLATPLDDALAVPGRGMICVGCVDAIRAVLAGRDDA